MQTMIMVRKENRFLLGSIFPRSCLAFLFFIIPQLMFAQQETFVCPVRKGKIVIEELHYDNGKRNPGAVFESKHREVFSCSDGNVIDIDTMGGGFRIYIEFEEYNFSYHRLSDVKPVRGQKVKKGELIGKVMEKERLFLICGKDENLIDPGSILPCKVVHRIVDQFSP